MRRRVLLGAVALAGVMVAAALLLRPRLEQAITRKLLAEITARGLSAEIGAVHVGLWPPVRLVGVTVRRGKELEARVPVVWVFPALRGSGLLGRLSVGLPEGMELSTRRGITLRIGSTSWRLARQGDGLSVRRTGTGASFVIRRAADVLRIEANNDAIGSWLEPRLEGRPLVDAGTVTGYVELRQGGSRFVVDLDLDVRDARTVSLESLDGEAVPPAWGGRFSARARLAGAWERESGTLSVTAARFTSDVAEAEATLGITGMGSSQAQVRLASEVKKLAFDRLFDVAGVVLPVATHGLGQAEVSLRVEGRQDEPEAARIDQRFTFTPPDRLPEALQALRSPFHHIAKLPDGSEREVLVSPDSPDFVTLGDVPPLFVRTLLLGEDSGFFGHHGLDLGEIPKALATDWARGGVARGASTITQQLAKNLFLSREKRVSRKLKELSLALLIEACLSKERILEIYLNVIEWGPGVYGLRSASRYYFGKEPEELTTAESAFLVATIPGPIKYQRSIATGKMSEGFRPLVENLLNKLLSVGAIDAGAHQAALAARLRFQHIPLPPEEDEVPPDSAEAAEEEVAAGGAE